jgi:sterol desaturase/sphingolipid hydroxylase (fatty acid hydroxylase superfamily)
MKSILIGLPYKSYLYGLCFYVIVSLVLLNLKLLGIISWSWLWIFAPLWVPLGITTAAIIITIVIEFLIFVFSPNRQIEFLKKFVRK